MMASYVKYGVTVQYSMQSQKFGLDPGCPFQLLLIPWPVVQADSVHTELKGSVKEPNISIYFFFPPITQWCSISDVLFTGGRGVSDVSVLKYY